MHKHFETILSNTTEGVFELDPDRRIIYANPKAVFWAGVPEENLLSRDFPGLFSASTRRKLIHLMDSGDGESKPFVRVLPATLNGREVSLKMIPIQDGDHRSMIVMVKDAGEEKRVEAQLQRIRKMEFIGKLAGAVAHDLNNLLSSIVSYPELILMDLPPGDPLTERIENIKKSGQRAAAIVRDMLILTRSGVTFSEPVDFNSVIADYTDGPEHQQLISSRPEIRVETDLSETPLTISGSPVHLKKIVANLVANAAAAIPHGGKIKISTRLKKIDRPLDGCETIPAGAYVRLAVSDTGGGISPRDRQSLFEPFYTERAMGRSGTGLGMAVVWGCVKNHKGYIDIRSVQGEGTQIRLYFPVTGKAPPENQKRLAIEKYRGNGESILVVDDMEDQRKIAAKLLSRLGYSVATAPNGEAAISFLEKNAVDLLVLDVLMDSHLNGLKTYEKILELHPGQKAVITSCFFETEPIRKARELGVGQYVSKPYVLEKMGMAIRSELDRE